MVTIPGTQPAARIGRQQAEEVRSQKRLASDQHRQSPRALRHAGQAVLQVGGLYPGQRRGRLDRTGSAPIAAGRAGPDQQRVGGRPHSGESEPQMNTDEHNAVVAEQSPDATGRPTLRGQPGRANRPVSRAESGQRGSASLAPRLGAMRAAAIRMRPTANGEGEPSGEPRATRRLGNASPSRVGRDQPCRMGRLRWSFSSRQG